MIPDYWLLTLIVLIVLVILNGIKSTLVTVTILLVVQYYIQSTSKISPIKNGKQDPLIIDNEISKYNETSLDSILTSTYQDADISLSNSAIDNGKKNKRATDIRSHFNNDNWKKYYDYEFNIHSGEHRDWWSNDDSELSKRHDISAFY